MSLIKKRVMRSVYIRSLARKVLFCYRRLNYIFKYRKYAVEDNLIIFEAFMGKSFCDSPKAIYMEMRQNPVYKKYKFVWVFKSELNARDARENNEIEDYVIYNTDAYYETLSKAKYWITNSRIKEHILKKNGQIYVQTWHGTPLKKIGLDIKVGDNALNSSEDIKFKYLSQTKMIDYFVSPSKFYTDKVTSAFNLTEKNVVIEEGYPRNDFLFKYNNDDIAAIKNRLDIICDKKIILYCPTWRDNSYDTSVGYTFENKFDFKTIFEGLNDDYIILYRAHYFIGNDFDFSKYDDVIDVSKYDDINELFVISDLLITDYSSVFFDFANLGRPIIFYMYDKKHYENISRGFYIDIETLPGPIVETTEDLILSVNNVEGAKKEYNYKYEKFVNKYCYLDDGGATQRVIKSFLEPDLISIVIPTYNVEDYIRECIDSIIKQSYGNIELLIYDDSSTDSTLDILNEYLEIDARIKVFEKKDNVGQGKLRNEGLRMSKGKYIMFIDADDFIEDDYLYEMHRLIYKSSHDFILSDWKFYSEEQIDYVSRDKYKHKIFNSKRKLSYLFKSKHYYAVTKLYSSSFLIDNEIRFGEGYIYEDNPFYVKCVISANSVAYCDKNYFVRLNDNSTTSSNRNGKAHYEGFIEAISTELSLFKNISFFSKTYLYNYIINRTVRYHDTRIPNDFKEDFINEVINVLEKNKRSVWPYIKGTNRRSKVIILKLVLSIKLSYDDFVDNSFINAE